jgi:dTDP-4-dehydrorhamnose 3,5-epimerase
MSEFYKPEATGGIRWNDPRLGIVWPRSEPILSARDRALPLLDEVFAVQ